MDFSHLWVDTITYSVGLTYSDGDFTASSTTTATGRLIEDHKVVKSAGGEERTATHRFATETSVPLNALVWIPGTDTADQGDAIRVLSRKFGKTLSTGYSYYILTLGR